METQPERDPTEIAKHPWLAPLAALCSSVPGCSAVDAERSSKTHAVPVASAVQPAGARERGEEMIQKRHFRWRFEWGTKTKEGPLSAPG